MEKRTKVMVSLARRLAIPAFLVVHDTKNVTSAWEYGVLDGDWLSPDQLTDRILAIRAAHEANALCWHDQTHGWMGKT